jgi:heterotetrameric sarcosine oxidase gamma subunit
MTTLLKLSPLNGAAERLGARWLEMAGWRCPEAYGDLEAEIAAIRAGCGLVDVSASGKLQIEGGQARPMLAAALGATPEAIGGYARVEAGDLYCLRPDMYFLLTPPGAESVTRVGLEAAAAGHGSLVTVTDLTHGLGGIALVGPRAVDVLRRVCGLDFDEAAFPNLTASQSSLAKTRQLILRRDRGRLPAYITFGARSLAAYVWGVLLDAGRTVGIAPVGLAALRSVEAG